MPTCPCCGGVDEVQDIAIEIPGLKTVPEKTINCARCGRILIFFNNRIVQLSKCPTGSHLGQWIAERLRTVRSSRIYSVD